MAEEPHVSPNPFVTFHVLIGLIHSMLNMVEQQWACGVGTKKKRVSKKNKKSWRKHTDVKDVDSFLDDRRLEERLGCVL
jgi:hypothetical protein